MLFATQKSLPFPVVAESKMTSATRSRLEGPGPREVIRSLQPTVAFPKATPRAPIRPLEGKSFARSRIQHAMELVGACIMMAVFLGMALLA